MRESSEEGMLRDVVGWWILREDIRALRVGRGEDGNGIRGGAERRCLGFLYGWIKGERNRARLASLVKLLR